MTPERWQTVKDLFARACELEGAAQRDYLAAACAGDAELRDEVLSLLCAHATGAAIVDRPAQEYVPRSALESAEDRWLGRRIGAYQLVECLGRGGMGEVYRARRADAEYEKEVAIKLVRSGYNIDLVRRRFMAERQILANLDHPNIAHLLDGGVTDDGYPYLVMELVRGMPIDEYCESQALSIPVRLRLFREVCTAVSYAHQHLVVHRDLKPSNILVTPEGSVKLLDFGIAKLLQAGLADAVATDVTRTAMQALTPAFSSPEQILGLGVTTSSDVYSLGVVLFHLLTGRSPYRTTLISTQDAIREVCETEPSRPSVAAAESVSANKSRAVPERDLDDITLKAMRKEPVNRYSSVDQLSADIERYLTGQPVSAHGAHAGYLARKFVRRHRLEIAAAGLLALTLIGGIVATSLEARRAVHAQARAEQDFARVRAMANSLLFELHDSIRDLPGATAARRLLVERAVSYLDSLSQEAVGDVAMQRELSAAYLRLGDIQGNPFTASLGDTGAALRSYAKALGLREAIHAQNPDNSSDELALAEALRRRADALSTSGQIEVARSQAARAVDISETLARARPKDRAVYEELALDYGSIAGILGSNWNSGNLGRQPEARAAHEKQFNAAARLLELDPGNVRYQSLKALSAVMLGDQLLIEGYVREAAPHYRDARESLALLAKDGTSQAATERYQQIFPRLADVQLWAGDWQAALASYRAAFELAQRLLQADPNDAHARANLAAQYANLADGYSLTRNFAEARRDSAKAIDMFAELLASDPGNVEYRVTDGLVYIGAGEAARRAGNHALALRDFRLASEKFRQVLRRDQNNSDARQNLAAGLMKQGDTLVAVGNEDAATAAYRESLGLAGAGESASLNEEARYTTAGAYTGLGNIEARRAMRAGGGGGAASARWNSACLWFDRAKQVWAKIPEPGALSPNGFYTSAPDVWRRFQVNCRSMGGAGVISSATGA